MNMYIIFAIIILSLFLVFKPFVRKCIVYSKRIEKEVDEFKVWDRWP